MGGAEENDGFKLLGPAFAALYSHVHATAHHEPAHAVGEYMNFLQWHRPIGQQLLQQQRQCLAVAGNVQAGVVAQGEQCAVHGLGQGLPMVHRLAFVLGAPLQVVHAQAVDQQQHAGSGLRGVD